MDMTILAGFLLFLGALGFCFSFAHADAFHVMMLPGWILVGIAGGLLLPWNRAKEPEARQSHQSIRLYDREHVGFIYIGLIFFIICGGLAIFIGLHSLNAAHPVMLVVISGVAISVWLFVLYGIGVERGNTVFATWFSRCGKVILLAIVGYSIYQLMYSVIPILLGTALVVRNHDVAAWSFWLPAIGATYTYGLVIGLLVLAIRFEDIHHRVSDALRRYLASRVWWPTETPHTEDGAPQDT